MLLLPECQVQCLLYGCLNPVKASECCKHVIAIAHVVNFCIGNIASTATAHLRRGMTARVPLLLQRPAANKSQAPAAGGGAGGV